RFFARKVAGEEGAHALAEEALGYIDAHLSRYAWPGNARELGHCVESIHHMGSFVPLEVEEEEDPVRSIREGTLTEDELNRRYRNILYAKLGSVAKAAEHLGV